MSRWWPYAPLLLALLYLIALIARFGSVTSATYLDADAASGPVIGQLLDTGAHAHVILGQFGWYSTFLFELATRWLPLHRQIWEAAPYAMALASALLTGWAAWWVGGRLASALTTVLMVCAAPHTLHLLLSATIHAPSWFCLALLGWLVVAIHRESFTERMGLAIASVLAVGIIVGAGAASDPLVVIGALVPFMA